MQNLRRRALIALLGGAATWPTRRARAAGDYAANFAVLSNSPRDVVG